MTSNTLEGNPYFDSSAESKGLLFQFIISEYISLCQLVNAANEGPFKQWAIPLCGSSLEGSGIFSWTWNGGALAKLKNYTSLFAKNHFHPPSIQGPPLKANQEKMKLQTLADRAWLISPHLVNALQSNDHTLLHKQLSSLNRLLAKFGQEIFKLTPSFINDENVLFFLLKNGSTLKSISNGSLLVTRLFNRMYHKNLELLEFFLLKKYEERGFYELLPIIRQNFDNLYA